MFQRARWISWCSSMKCDGIATQRNRHGSNRSVINSNHESGTYPALLRLQQRKWIKAEWGISRDGSTRQFYSLSKLGQQKIATKTENWERVATTMARFLTHSS